jgi:hypothetical protein
MTIDGTVAEPTITSVESLASTAVPEVFHSAVTTATLV